MRAHGAGLPSPLALAMASLLSALAAATAVGCSRAVPTAPSAVIVADPVVVDATGLRGAAGASDSLVSSSLLSPSTQTVDLSGGTFTLTTTNRDELTGTYTGRATLSPSRGAAASLDLRVTGGTGAFQGASGTLRGEGTGTFTGEGPFSLSLKGSLSLTSKPGASNFQADFVGNAVAGCVSGRTTITLLGSGSSKGFGGVTETLSHSPGNAICIP